MPYKYDIIQIAVTLAMVMEQICFSRFAIYPYKFGIPIMTHDILLLDLRNLTNIEDHLGFIMKVLHNPDEHAFIVHLSSQSIYIRSTYNRLN